MSEKFTLERTSDVVIWDSLLEKSPQCTIFMKDSYLRHLGISYELWIVKKGNEPRAGFLVLPDSSRLKYLLNELIIYAGIFFVPDLQVQKPAKIYSEQFEITEMIIKNLTGRFQRVEIALTPQFVDIRPFLWFNYHEIKKEKQFEPSIRYTSYINISELSVSKKEEDYELFKRLDVIRQRNIRRARKEGGYIKEENRIEEFLNYYVNLMKNQNQTVPVAKLNSMQNLIQGLLNEGMARMFVSYNANHQIGSINTYCFDSRRAYYLFGASNSKTREEYCGTIVFWDSFIELAKTGIKVIDMEGINSPQRGWFKLSFGGDMKAYYEMNYGI